MKAKVYFSEQITPEKVVELYKAVGLELPGKVAVKVHSGEPGNQNFLTPEFWQPMVETVHGTIVECNTAYPGERNTTNAHRRTMIKHGWSKLFDVDILDAEGPDLELPIPNGKRIQKNLVGKDIKNYDSMLVLSHFKGHPMGGFGGALKNLGMGCASVAGKMELHASSQPKIDREHCRGCNICVTHCRHQAIHLDGERKAVIDYSKCVGCGQCVALCQFEGAVLGEWDTSENLNYKIAEYTEAVLKDKPNFHVSFIMNVSPECDCWNHNDAAIIPDLGMLASFDPVALDEACADLVNQAAILETNNRLSEKPHEGHLENCDKFHLMHPDTNWQAGLEHAEKRGIGTRAYELITV